MERLTRRIEDSLQGLISSEENLSSCKFLLAVSGGMDSMVMAHCFVKLNLNFGIAHFNFQLRGEASDLDEELVRDFCQRNKIPFHTRSEDTTKKALENKLSTQEMARKLRYEFFNVVTKKNQYDYICTAHHGNDQLETFFIHLFRGSGLKGLTGIPEKRNQIIRPMLWIPKSEIERYADEHNISYREDESNKSDKYLRNRIRHHLIEPVVKTNPEYLIKSLDSISFLNEYQVFMDHQIGEFQKTYVKWYSSNIQVIAIPEDVFQNPSLLFLLKLYLLDQDIYPSSTQDLMISEGSRRIGSIYKGQSVKAWYDRDKLWIIKDSFFQDWDRKDIIEIAPGSPIDLPGGDYIDFHNEPPGNSGQGSWIIPVIRDKVSFPLQIRHRKPGDYITLGSPPFFRKSLKKLLNDHKIPRPFKDRLYLLVDAEGRMVSVPGLVNSPQYTTEMNPDLIIRYNSNLSFLFKKESN